MGFLIKAHGHYTVKLPFSGGNLNCCTRNILERYLTTSDGKTWLDVLEMGNYNNNRRKSAGKREKKKKIRIQVKNEKWSKSHEIHEKNCQDIKTPRKRWFIRIFWKIPAKQASESLVNQGLLKGRVEMKWSSEEHWHNHYTYKFLMDSQ